jgi:glycosyltransferase involved in cell wall biosynthesis
VVSADVAAQTPAPAPIEVLWLIKGLGAGGAETLLVSFARGADRQRFHFTAAYVLDWKTALAPALEQAGVDVHCLGARDARDLRWLLALRRYLRTHRVDVIHVHSPLVAALSRLVLLTLRNRPPVVSTEHNTWASHGRYTRVLNRLTYRLDKAHISVSDVVQASLPPRLRTSTEVIVHGVEVRAIRDQLDQRDAVRDEFGLTEGQVAVCTVANLRWQKGYPDLLAAAREVVDAGHDVVFLAVGQGPLEADIRARRDELQLGDRFRLLGYREDAIRILAGCDIFALASLHEGYPIAVMEAMVMGLPIIATDAGGIPQAVRNGIEGFVVPSQRPSELAAALMAVIADDDLRGRMSEAAMRRGAAFDIVDAVTRTEAIYSRLRSN